MRFFCGIDGGGSATRVLIGTDDGSVWGYGAAGGCNPHELGIQRSITELRKAMASAWAGAGISPQPFAGAFFGIAGIGSFSPAQKRELSEWLPAQPDHLVEVDHDIRIALAGGVSGRSGVAVVAGTGSAGYGRSSDGRTARAGGWGGLLDDAGGGYWLGIQALRAVTRARDGRGAATILTQTVLRALQTEDEIYILEWLRRSEVGRPDIAALAGLVFEAAAGADPVAQSIMAEGARELAMIAEATARGLFPKGGGEVIFTGGLSKVAEYSRLFQAALSRTSSNLRWTPAEHSPLVGALLLAANLGGLESTSEWLKKAEIQIERAPLA